MKQRVQQINAARRFAAPGRQLCGSSCSYAQLQAEPQLALDFIIAPPRMAYYMEYSTRIYEIYLRYVAPGGYHSLFCGRGIYGRNAVL